MKNKRLIISSVLFFFFILPGLQAQNAVLSTGGEAFGTGGSADYSVGQLVYTTITGTSGSVAQGVQQPFEISTLTGIEKAKDINLFLLAYPNPTTDDLILRVNGIEISKLSFQLFDMSGKIIRDRKITGNETKVGMGNLAPATYYVRVLADNKEIKIFQIIKY